MSNFRFLHAADLHLDSPLLGLAGKSVDYAARIEAASREAFDNLIALAIDERCRFLLLAGDIFDGELRNFQTGLYFIDGMRRLADAGIAVFVVLGNHDSANRFADKLVLSKNVHVFAKARAGSQTLDDIGVAIHGRSFPRPDVNENIARDYPPSLPGLFNIGVLHTACQGSEGHHALYAPCSSDQLSNHGYDYWALGHVHAHQILGEHPHIVYPGNLQGRHPRETGPKGAVLVTVEDGRVAALEHRALDVVRWASVTVDLSGCGLRAVLFDEVRESLSAACAAAEGRPIALRLIFEGATALHGELVGGATSLRDDIEALLATLSDDVWLEKLQVSTETLRSVDSVDPTISGRLEAEILSLGANGSIAATIEARLAEIRAKLPAGAHAEAFLEQMRADIPARATALARSLVSEGGDATH